MSEGMRSGVNWNPVEAHVENSSQRADHQRFGQTGYAFEQTVAPGEDGSEQLLDDFVLPNHDFLQLLLHQHAMLPKLLQDVSETTLFGRHRWFPDVRLLRRAAEKNLTWHLTLA